ncbi:glutamine--fructose-6-phosphate transaminase (isomerizing) [Halegenticoccus tardaugens]|uniref:glutamine--fructose-6-phosphate transaminase (isomerizing) n=1 Tax=Halegenticoccus tardaugens TaxID=2071624 RepID=UPI00100B5EDD|nr:glutamine--fructose-6-phosphate transaminase (isomerizing) [Halegenticoccus tardaugens]
MCGIIACIGSDDAVGELLTGLENLEYRGYDSAGIAVQNGTGIAVRKKAGKISELKNTIARDVPNGTVGIGHTRWSTHGPPTDANAHPHTSRTDRVVVVHNGIIENYESIRRRLAAEGYEFKSETDTEVIPHLVEHHLDEGLDVEDAFKTAIGELDGSYAIALMINGTDTVYAARQDSPLVIGVDDDRYYLASDVPAFLDFTDEVIYIEDGEFAKVRPGELMLTDREGNVVDRDVETVEWSAEETGKGEYTHYMLKEINEQADSIANTIAGRIGDDGSIHLEEFPPGTFEDIDEVEFVACGTSYHAALYGVQLLRRAGIRAHANLASEYDTTTVTDRTLVVAVTQSGETADTMSALRAAQDAGAETVAVTNVVGSSAARQADHALYIRAGPEIGVAATKTFSSQVVTLTLLGHRLAEDLERGRPREDAAEFFAELRRLPTHIEKVLETTRAREISEKYLDKRSYFFIGRDNEFPVALEGALKFKEITYEHAEGFASGELKHGPLALVTDETAVFALFTGTNGEETRKNAEEAHTRGANIVAVAPDGTDVGDVADSVLWVPKTHPDLAGLLANVQLQLVSYYTANLLGREIDKPRNLAKSVTVE